MFLKEAERKTKSLRERAYALGAWDIIDHIEEVYFNNNLIYPKRWINPK
jgi:hypothetical protein